MVAQSATRPKYFDRARIDHGDSTITITAFDSTPLFQAVYALRLQYGWQVDWESAPGFSQFDLVDDTDPKWRTAHPSEKGVTRPSGGLFVASLPEPTELDASSEEDFLEKLITQYNATSNPGRYTLRRQGGGELAIVGDEVRDDSGALRKITPLFDTKLTIERKKRSVAETIETILRALQFASGTKVIVATATSTLFRISDATIGGDSVPARQLLREALDSTGGAIQYDLLFNADVPAYVLNLSPTMREEDHGVGGKKLTPVETPRRTERQSQ